MTDPCVTDCCPLDAFERRQRRTLKTVLGINTIMFAVELTAGLVAGSTALLADSLDMLGDALAYGVTLYAVGRGALWKARAVSVKGVLMAAFGIFVLIETAVRSLSVQVPNYETMGTIALIALLANAVCLVLLRRHRSDDLNMRSVWLCSRNDILANAAVLAAAAGVRSTQSIWPDVIVGLGIALLFLRSATGVLAAASRDRRTISRC